MTTGDMFLTHADGRVGELEFSRTFNSARVTQTARYGAFGPGWNSSLEGRLRILNAKTIEVRAGGGEPHYYFDAEADGVYAAVMPTSSESWIETIAGGYRRVFRKGGQQTYDSTGQLTTATDAAGVPTTYSRDGQGRLVSVSRFGRSLNVVYAGSSTKPLRIEGPGGVVLASYAFGANGLLDGVDYPDGSGYRYFYDSFGRILSVEDPSGGPIESHEYDAAGRATTSEIANGVQKLVLSYAVPDETTLTDAAGNTTTYEYTTVKGIPRVTRVTGPCGSCGGSGGDVQEWAYDARGNITSYKDAANKIWSYTYNANDDLLTVTDPLNRVTTHSYDAAGRVLTQSGPGGSLTTYTHGPAGPLTIAEKLDATETRTTSFTYNGSGRIETITDPRQKVTVLDYDPSGDLVATTDPLNHATSFGYDGLGRRTSVTDALNHSVTTAYDARGRVTRVTSDDGTHTDFGYDSAGRWSSVTDPMDRKTGYFYDAFGRLNGVVDPLGGLTKYSYDMMSNLTLLTDAKGQATAFEYDPHRRVTKVTYPGGAFESFSYGPTGRLLTRTDRKSVVTTYSHDDLGRLTGKSYSDGTTPAVTYTYNAAGQLATAANGTDTLTWTYDVAGQLLSEQGSKNGSTVAYTHDLGGNRVSLSLDGQVFVTNGYDDASRLLSITRGTGVFGFGYDAASRRTSMSYPNGITTSYTYDSLDRLTRLKADLASTPITDFQYLYDSAGNRTRKQQLDYTEDYGYDPLYRLKGVDRTGAGAVRQYFTYDPVGNRTVHQADASVVSATFNERNQLLSASAGGPMRWRGALDEPGNVALTSVLVNGKQAQMLPGNVFEAEIPVSPGTNTVTVEAMDTSANVRTNTYELGVSGSGATYTYDPNGNLSQKGEGTDNWAYEWNAENQLTRVCLNVTPCTDANATARFAYDPLGRRVEKVAGGTTTTWTYDGEDMLREIAGATTTRYIHGAGIDEPLAQEGTGGALTYYHADGLGSVLNTTSAAGAVTLTRQYDAWGNLQAGSTTPGYAFTGREWDPEIGLYYYRARYYDSKSGRFTSEDPIGLDGGINFYAYVENNPVLFVDPDGLRLRPPVRPPIRPRPRLTPPRGGQGFPPPGPRLPPSGPKPTPQIGPPGGSSGGPPPSGLGDSCPVPSEEDCFRLFRNAQARCLEDYRFDPLSKQLCIKLARVELRICLGQEPLPDPF